MTVGYAADTDCLVIISEHKNGSITLEPITAEKGVLSFSGKYSHGAGYSITLKITDDETDRIYALAEKTTKNKGVFKIDAGLSSAAYGRNLTAYLVGGEDPEAYRVKFTYGSLAADTDYITITSQKNTDMVVLDTVSDTNMQVVISGVYSDGAGYKMNLTVTDSVSGKQYTSKTANSKNGGKFSFNAELPLEAYGRSLTAKVKSSEDTEWAELVFTCSGGASKNKLMVAEYISDIEELIAECEEKGLSVEYEKTDLAIIKRFDGFIDDFYSNGNTTEYEHNIKVVLELGEETVADLNGYLNGTKAEKVAPIYKSSKITTDGQSFMATTEVKGEQRTQPVFLNGYGHWADALSDYDSLASMGANTSHYEVGPGSILKQSGSSYTVNQSGVQTVKDVFKKAEDNNLSVTFMTAVHYFPEFIYNMYSDIATDSLRGNTMVPYNPTHPEVKNALEAFLRAVVPEIKDYKSFHSICLANEPMFVAIDHPDRYYEPAYREFLREKYGTVAALNKAHKSDWDSFDDVTFTVKDPKECTAEYIDYREFNDGILTEWFSWMKEIINDIDPTIPVHVKCSAYISSGGDGARRRFCGTNYEKWSQIMDLNGCDAWSRYGNEAYTVQGKTMWYDFMTSMKNAPIVNSEDHFLDERDDYATNDTKIFYNENEYLMGMADVWQGAIHGRASSVYWLWDKSSRTQSGTWYYNCNLTRRADYAAGIGKTNHDLNRLANEITAIQKKGARVGVMYSNYSQISNKYQNAAMYEAYRRMVNSGEKVFVANDTYPEKINENEDLKVLVLPVCQNMPEKVWQELKKFEQNGRKLIFAEYENDYYDENGCEIDSALKNEVLSNSERVSFTGWTTGGTTSGFKMTGCEALYEAIDKALSGLTHSVTVTDASKNTEWTAAEYDGGYVVNLFNSSESDVSVKIKLTDGNEFKLFDLTENEAVSGDSLTLTTYETKLLKLTPITEVHGFTDGGGAELSAPKAGDNYARIKTTVSPGASYVHVVALYKGGELIKTEVQPANADNGGKIDSKLKITLSADNVSGAVIKSFLFDSLKSIKPYIPSAVLGNQQ